jgi:hypothetical protein
LVHDFVDHLDNVGAGNRADRPIAPTVDQLAPNSKLNIARGPFAGDMLAYELLGDLAVQALLLGGLGFGLLGFALAGIDPVVEVAQDRAAALARSGERDQRVGAATDADRLSPAASPPPHCEETDAAVPANANAEAANGRVPNCRVWLALFDERG